MVPNHAREAGIERLVYLSVMHSDRYVNPPHFSGRFGVERMIEQMGLNATVLCPVFFIDNDLSVTEVVRGCGVYPMPIDSKGLAMVDEGDVGEIAALELIRREQAALPLPFDRFNLVGPYTMTGADVAAIWPETLGRAIAYGGKERERVGAKLKQSMPSCVTFDMRLMIERLCSEGKKSRERRHEAFDHASGLPTPLISRFCVLSMTAQQNVTTKQITRKHNRHLVSSRAPTKPSVLR